MSTQEHIVYRNKLEQQTDEGVMMLLEWVSNLIYNYWWVGLILGAIFYFYLKKKKRW